MFNKIIDKMIDSVNEVAERRNVIEKAKIEQAKAEQERHEKEKQRLLELDEKELLVELIFGMRNMEKCEYKVLNMVNEYDIEKKLNEMAEQGWLLNNIVEDDSDYTIIMERKIKNII